jgi:hypothetical protein
MTASARPLYQYSAWTGFRAGVKLFPPSILNDMLPNQQLYGGTMEIEEGPMSKEEAVLTARRMWGNQAWVMSSGTFMEPSI